MQDGETPSVLAMSWGRGDYQKDDITIVYLDLEGRMREHTRIDNLTDQDNQEELADLIARRKPEVIVIGGFSMTTTRLAKDLQQFLSGGNPDMGGPTRDPIDIEVTYVQDEVARLYQHSKRAEAEFGALPTLTKYCIGLARYAQSPLNEYASLGEDLVAVSFDERYQHLVSFAASLCELHH
jgi:transcription elongation factor SPT6